MPTLVFTLVLVTLLLLQDTAATVVFGDGYQYAVNVSVGAVMLAWTVHDPLFDPNATVSVCATNGTIDIQLAWYSSGWGAIGFGPEPWSCNSGKRRGGSSGTTCLDHYHTDFFEGSSRVAPRNAWSSDYDWPRADGNQSVRIWNTSFAYVNGWSIMSFTRPLGSVSSTSKPVLCNQVTTAVWAYALTNTNLNDGATHLNYTRGQLALNFYRDPTLSAFGNPATDPLGQSYGNLVTLDPNYRLYWRWNPGNLSLDIAVTAYTVGWVTLGFEPDDQSHQNTDMIMGYILNGGTGASYVEDMWSTTFATPVIDSVNNVVFTSVQEANGFTTVRFSRFLNSTDAKQDKNIGYGPRKVVWAYGPSDPATPSTPAPHSSTSKGLVMIDWTNPPGITQGVAVAPNGPGTTSIASITNVNQLPGMYTHQVALDGRVTMFWTIDTGKQEISIALLGVGFQGWIGIAIKPSSHPHLNSDMIMGNAGGLVDDYYSNAITAPTLDTVQNIISWACIYLNGDTVITFTRQLTTPDGAQDNAILPGPQHFAWAYCTSSQSLSVEHDYGSGVQPLTINWYTGQLTGVTGQPLWHQVFFFLIPGIVIFLYQKLIFYRSFSFLFIFRKPLVFRFMGNKYNYTLTDAIVIVAWAMLASTWTGVYAYTVFGQWNVVGLSLQYHCALLLLPILRNSIFEPIFGISFDRAIKYHRWLGYSTCLVLFMHAVGNWVYWKKTGIFQEWSLKHEMVFGELAFVVSLIMVFFAVSFWRRQFFESFLATHMLYPLFILFSCLHSRAKPNQFGWYFFPSVMLFVIDKIIRGYRSWKSVKATEIRHVNGLTRLQIERPAGMKYEGGQYMFIMIPEISRIEWHPFSIASSPRDEDLMLCIRDAGGWTHSLLELAQKNFENLKVHIDGPYGTPSIDLYRFKVAVLLSGGVGAVPFISILRELLTRIKQGDKLKVEKVIFVWSVRNENNWEWFEDTLSEVMSHPVASQIIDLRIYGSNVGRSWVPKETLAMRVKALLGCYTPPTAQAAGAGAKTTQVKKEPEPAAQIQMESLGDPAAAAAAAAPADEWTEYVDETSGAVYYHNSVTGESSWTKPAPVKRQANFRKTLNLSAGQSSAALTTQKLKPKFIEGRPNVREIFNECVDKYPHVDKFAVLACGPMGMVYDARELCFEFSEKRNKLFHFHAETFEF